MMTIDISYRRGNQFGPGQSITRKIWLLASMNLSG